jgi:hypothetical protein
VPDAAAERDPASLVSSRLSGRLRLSTVRRWKGSGCGRITSSGRPVAARSWPRSAAALCRARSDRSRAQNHFGAGCPQGLFVCTGCAGSPGWEVGVGHAQAAVSGDVVSHSSRAFVHVAIHKLVRVACRPWPGMGGILPGRSGRRWRANGRERGGYQVGAKACLGEQAGERF